VNAMDAGRLLDAAPVTFEEYLGLPESLSPCEFVDGQAIVSPSPTLRHQVAAQRLSQVLAQSAPAGLLVVQSPLDWVLSEVPLTVRQPDIAVVDAGMIDQPRLETAPILVAEILSPTSRERDLVVKRRQYAAAGLRWYWLVDLDIPQILVLGNDGGHFAEVASSIGKRVLAVQNPFPVRVRPADLV
jgi:Uma2 family endonuclease